MSDPLPAPQGRENILQEAQRIVHGPRRDEYGTPLQNHTRTANFWNEYLGKRCPGIQLTAEDVCYMNILQKVARKVTTDKITRDGIVDIAGYAANIELVMDERRAQTTPNEPPAGKPEGV
jgi:hypothetical protein